MKSIKKILIALLVVAAILFGFYAYFGGFNKLNFKVEKAGGETIVYKHKYYNKSGSDKAGANTLLYRVCAESWPDRSVFKDLDRNRQSTGSEHYGKSVCFGSCELTCYLCLSS